MAVTMKINKSTNVTANIMVGNTVVAYVSATISTENGTSNVNENVRDAEAYRVNKAEIREKVAEFRAEVYKLEDALMGGE